MSRQSTLPTTFYWLNAAQFLGAFNDNLFKLLVIFQLITLKGAEHIVAISATAGAVFVLPFILFAPLAGLIADRYPKHKVLFIAKSSEVIIMCIGTLFFTFENASGLYFTLFLMALQSTIVGPAKHGLLPEFTSRIQLPRANGILTMSSYLAIISGTITAAILSALTGGHLMTASLFCIAVALPGAICMSRIDMTPDNSTIPKKTQTGFRQAFKAIYKTPALILSITGASLFLFIGAFCQLSIIPFGMDALHLSREQSSYMFLSAALGIGLGGFTAGKLSRTGPNLSLIASGGFGIALFSLLLGSSQPSVILTGLLLFALGFSGGLFITPVNTLIQLHSPAHIRGRILSISYMLNFCMVLAAALTLGHLGKSPFPVNSFFLLPSGIGTLLLTGSIVTTPRWIIRSLAAILIHLRYRFSINRPNNIPVEGPAIIVLNHVSWIDGLLAMAAVDKPMHFLMKRSIYESSLLRPFFALAGILPISYTDGPHTLHRTLEKAENVLKQGGIIALFPEGAISRDGFIHRCRNGYRKLAEKTGASVIPAYIHGAWGCGFSYYGGKLFSNTKLFSRRAISVTFGTALPSDTPPETLRSAIEACGADAAHLNRNEQKTLAISFIISARKYWFRKAISDSSGTTLNFGKSLVAAITISDALRKTRPDQPMTGILLPASAGGSLVNVATTLSGKIPVNLNFTASEDALKSAIRQCRITEIITSRKFIAKATIPALDVPYLFIEDLLKTITWRTKTVAFVKAMVVPAQRFGRTVNAHIDDCAAILFSSGSTAEPKGIMLSHGNILANVTSMHQAIATDANDTLCAALPFFHSFGFTATIWFPLLNGFHVSYHPNPLDGNAIASLVKKHRGTLLLATPTFLRTYLKKASRDAFASLRFVITGAEKLRPALAEQFHNKFGTTLLEGYGATELAPVATLNVPDTYSPDRHFTGNKPGTIGRALPGITVRTVDPETGNPLPHGTNGLLLVKGANVMTGYLGERSRTTRVLKDGWYNTGDIARIDQDGFITLTDRLSRFSKIAGEMVPHGAVEDIINERIGAIDDYIAIVTAVPDDIKGEKLAVIFTNSATTRTQITEIISNAEIPNLWKPQHDQIFGIDALPLLGNGKIDLRSIREHAMKMGELKAAA